jgi:PKD domain
VVTVGDAGSLRITQTDSVVTGEEAFTTVVEVANTGGADVEAVLYRAGDCYISSSDRGFGSYDGASGAIGCVEEEAGAPGSRVAEFVPLSPGSDYFEGHYDDVWTQIDTRASFPNTCLCDTALDNGAGLSWNLTVPAGGSITRSHRVRWGSGGINQPPVPIMSGLPVDWGGPFTLTFEGGGSFDLDGQVVGYEWDFGDGGTSTEQTPTHGYLATGTFTVSLTVTDDDGGTATAFEDLTITGVTSVDFAPEVRLHPEEDHFPMNPVTFVDGANLQWAHDHGCDNDFVVENPIADLLGQPNEYEHRVDRGVFPRCGRHSGRHYDSQDYTRPFDDGNPERENIAGEEGFYLDFDEGSEPDAFSPVPVWTERTTLADGNTALTYWFFYGRSVPRWNGIGLPT